MTRGQYRLAKFSASLRRLYTTIIFKKTGTNGHQSNSNHILKQKHESPPPGAGTSSMFAPHSPPPGVETADQEDESDPYLERILKIREVAIRLAGGEDIWDALDEDDVDIFMELAGKEVDLGS